MRQKRLLALKVTLAVLAYLTGVNYAYTTQNQTLALPECEVAIEAAQSASQCTPVGFDFPTLCLWDFWCWAIPYVPNGLWHNCVRIFWDCDGDNIPDCVSMSCVPAGPRPSFCCSP
ncbi:MAG: hypothetical protein ACK4I8_09915 [Armatimonadota bacterium]